MYFHFRSQIWEGVVRDPNHVLLVCIKYVMWTNKPENKPMLLAEVLSASDRLN